MHLDALSAAQLGEQLGAKEGRRLDDTGASRPTMIEDAMALCKRLVPSPIANDPVLKDIFLQAAAVALMRR